MRFRRVAGALALFITMSLLLSAVFFSRNSLLNGASRDNQPITQATSNSKANAIVLENAQVGTSNWKIPDGSQAITEIQAYASATSVLPGHNLTFYVSTQEEGISYSIDIYRLGWYGGTGGRLMFSQANRLGHAQGYYDQKNRLLVGCTSCHVDTHTGLIEANWQPSYILTVPSDWVTGIYLAKFSDANGKQTYVPFDVLGNSSSAYVAVTPDTTYAAYNDWGGYNLSEQVNSLSSGENVNPLGGVKVSFDRPYTMGYGSAQVLVYIADSIHWLERQGYDLSYMSDVDLHENPAQLLHHHAYLSLGHDEYWTKEMRDGVEYARDHGVGLAFLGANASFWQMRFEPDSAGAPNRTVVCYKVETSHHDLAHDPFYGKDNTRLTSQWRDPVLARPENSLIGIMYTDLTHQRLGFPWQVSSQAKTPLLRGTGLQSGRQYGCDLVGYEWDRIVANGRTPSGLQVLGISNTMNDNNTADFSNTTYYIVSSGAMVFATGSIYWTAALDDYRFLTDKACTSHSTVVPEMQKLMANVMQALLVPHLSGQLTSMSTTPPLLTSNEEAVYVQDSSAAAFPVCRRPLNFLSKKAN